MSVVKIPYGKTFLSGNVNDDNLLGIYHSSLPPAAADPAAEVARALDEPIGSLPLEELARGKKDAVIIASDHTRPVPSKFLMPALLKRLRKGSPDIKITILIATGCHRNTTKEELIEKFGPEIADSEEIIVHDCANADELVELGTLPSGGKLVINRRAVETELLIAEGFIEPHFFAGFSGGRKSVLPGVAGRQTVLANHCSEFIQSPCARTGILENNPIHIDMLFAARQAKLAFILNSVINGEKAIVKCFAGGMYEAHAAGCEYLKKCCGVQVPVSNIVITGNGGYPLDQNIYQCVKGMTAGEAAVRDGGVIILAASCCDGHGGEAFYKVLSRKESAAELLGSIASIPRDQTQPDQWQYQILARILSRCTVIMVTRDCDHAMIKSMKMLAAFTLDEALSMAYDIAGKAAKVAVIPDGVSVMVQ